MKVGWSAATEPLAAIAVAGRGTVGTALRERASRDDRLAVTDADPWIVIRGDDLPWADGAVYLGALAGAPTLLVPVHRRPTVPPDVLAAAVRRLAAPDTGPFALLPSVEVPAPEAESAAAVAVDVVVLEA